MKNKKRLQAMANAIDAKLPSDNYASPDEWFQRQSERFRDGGYTKAEIETMMASNMQKARDREEAKQRFGAIVDAKMRGVDPSGRDLTIAIIKGLGISFSLRPGRDIKRMMRLVKKLKSSTIRNGYLQLHNILAANAGVRAVQDFFNHDAAATQAWGLMAKQTWWRPRENALGSWYPNDAFFTCTTTGERAPRAQGLNVVIDERGVTRLMHPSVGEDTSLVRRDGPTGNIILISAVEWVPLESGDLVWKRANLASGAIFFDEERNAYVRANTRGAVAVYHGAPRRWRERSRDFTDHIGVELEIGWKTREHLSKFLNRYVEPNGRFIDNRPFMIESDSSLGSITGGVEVISEPLPLYEGYQAPDAQWRWLLGLLVQSGAEGWKHRNLAGIHVNMDVSSKTPRQILRFIALINNAASISRFISGRKYIYGAEGGSLGHAADSELEDIGAFTAKDKNQPGGGYQTINAATFRSVGKSDTILTADALTIYRGGNSKYRPVHIRREGNVLEVRIFGSNCRYEGFMACVEYCVGGMEFATGIESDTAALHPEIGTHFREWLSNNVEKYPNLASRLGVIQSTGSSSSKSVARALKELVA